MDDNRLIQGTFNGTLPSQINAHFSDPRENLYTLMAYATLSDDNKTLKFGPNSKKLLYLYIHPSWSPMYERITRNFDEYGKDRILVTGTPGIGKSSFSYYYIWRAICQDKLTSFLYQNSLNSVELHLSSTVVLIADTGICPKGLPFFVDMKTHAEPDPAAVERSAYTIIFSSPDNSRFKDFMKDQDRIKYILEPWSEEEINEAWRLVPSFSKVSEEVVGAQYAIYGGIPRSVFCHAEEVDEPMKHALSTKGKETAAALMTGSIGEGPEVQLSHMVLHMRPQITKTHMLTDVEFFFPASPFVVRELVKVYRELMFQKFWEWTKFKSAIYKSGAGLIFETLYQIYMSNRQHNITSLQGIALTLLRVAGLVPTSFR